VYYKTGREKTKEGASNRRRSMDTSGMEAQDGTCVLVHISSGVIQRARNDRDV